VPGIGSFFWWKGRIEDETDVLAVFKTSESQADALAAFIADHRAYETPVIVRQPQM
jgi:uncharacterized protein involved in tolerance to divalent cations